MLVDEFDYDLPPDLIAQEPAERREGARLMTIDRQPGLIGESTMAGIAGEFRDGDLLVINNTRVIPARLQGVKESGGKTEVFLVRRTNLAGEVWICLIGCSKRPRPGVVISFAEGVRATVLEKSEGETWLVSFSPVNGFDEWLERTGSIPLPPYIKRSEECSDRERYQTVFAREKGAVAAPTAGLHFSKELLGAIRQRGVEIVPLTLHVGLGTFMPIRTERVEEHRMHREYFNIPDETAAAVQKRKRNGGRVIALGTTVARTLEYAALADGSVVAGNGEADIFIYPGYGFKVIDALITNFHLPRSTLLMLVSAFAGKDLLFAAYAEAVKRRFRFFSYGDAMFIY